MVHLLNQDGKCKYCEAYSDIMCDNCSIYVCEEHRVRQKVAEMSFIDLCKDCAKKGKRRVQHYHTEMMQKHMD